MVSTIAVARYRYKDFDRHQFHNQPARTRVSSPRDRHLVASKRARRYLKERPNLELAYGNKTTLKAFCDARFASSGNPAYKPIIGVVVMPRNEHLLHRSRCWNAVCVSSTEAEVEEFFEYLRLSFS